MNVVFVRSWDIKIKTAAEIKREDEVFPSAQSRRKRSYIIQDDDDESETMDLIVPSPPRQKRKRSSHALKARIYNIIYSLKTHFIDSILSVCHFSSMCFNLTTYYFSFHFIESIATVLFCMRTRFKRFQIKCVNKNTKNTTTFSFIQFHFIFS